MLMNAAIASLSIAVYQSRAAPAPGSGVSVARLQHLSLGCRRGSLHPHVCCAGTVLTDGVIYICVGSICLTAREAGLSVSAFRPVHVSFRLRLLSFKQRIEQARPVAAS